MCLVVQFAPAADAISAIPKESVGMRWSRGVPDNRADDAGRRGKGFRSGGGLK